MDSCEIFTVKHDATFGWKWRYIPDRGEVQESEKEYALFYECLSAARKKGYSPKFSRD
jgi:hypothetical protein